MAFNFGTFTEFDDPVTKGDPVILVAAKAVEPPAFKGVFYQSLGAPSVPITQKEYEIYSRSKTTRNGVIGKGSGENPAWSADATTGLPMSADAVKGLTVGHVLRVDNEIVQVKSVSRSAGTIDVWARGAGGTTAATHASDTAFAVIGFAGADEDLKNVESFSESSSVYTNYVQTVFETLDWTKHGELVRKGLTPAQAQLVLLREAELRVAEALSLMSIHGVKELAAQGGNRSMSAGLFAQLADTNNGNRPVLSYNANGTLTEEKMKAALREVFKTGNPNTIWCSYANKDVINTFNIANPNLSVGASVNDHTAGTYIDKINFEGRILAVRIDIDMPDDKIAIVNQGKCKKGWLQNDGLTLKDEPAASSREFRKSIQGSVGFIVEDVGYEHTFIEGITH